MTPKGFQGHYQELFQQRYELQIAVSLTVSRTVLLTNGSTNVDVIEDFQGLFYNVDKTSFNQSP